MAWIRCEHATPVALAALGLLLVGADRLGLLPSLRWGPTAGAQPPGRPVRCDDPAVCVERHHDTLRETWSEVFRAVGELNATAARSPCWWDDDGPGWGLAAGGAQGSAAAPAPASGPPPHRRRRRYRCLPGLMLLGTPKSGTTDMFDRLTMHPAVFGSSVKEPHWFTRSPGGGKRFRGYLNTIMPQARAGAVRQVDGVVFEASASTFWDRGAYGWPNPMLHDVLVPEVLAELVGNRTKFAVLLRDPVDRMYSSYQHFRRVTLRNAERRNNSGNCRNCITPTRVGFHWHVVKALRKFDGCVSKHTRLECAYLSVRQARLRPYLAIGMYDVFLQVWWRYFPRHRLKVIFADEYFADTAGTLGSVLTFLGLDRPEPELWSAMITRPVSNKGASDEPMLPETRGLLREFYRPHEAALRELLRRGDGQPNASAVLDMGRRE